MGKEFGTLYMKKFWRWMAVMVAQNVNMLDTTKPYT